MREALFCTEIVNSLKSLGAFVYKIPDSPASYGSQKMRFSTPKRFDIHAVYRGKPFAIECKQYKEFKGFGLTQIRDEQINALTDYQSAGGNSFVFLNIRIPRLENRLLIFDWPDFHRKLKESGKCIGKKELSELPFIAGRKGVFNLFHWIERI